MKQLSRRLGTMLLATAGLVLVGCGGTQSRTGGEGVGQLALPLTTQGASGVTYRLRNANFAIHRYTGYYASMGSAGSASSAGGFGVGATGGMGDQLIAVSSETDPDAKSISLSLEEGDYYVELLPGWGFEKNTPQGAQPVEATLLTSETQWIYVSRQATSWAEYQFGLGGRELWLNGKLNIDVVLHEDPQVPIGTGGYPGGYGGGPIGGYSGGSCGGPAGGYGSASPGGAGGAPSGGSGY